MTSLAGDLFGSHQKKKAKVAAGRPPHVIVKALAGTGKTSTIVEGLKELRGIKPAFTPSSQQRAIWDAIQMSVKPARVAFCAYNRDIAAELKHRMPPNCEAMTVNSMGNKIVVARFGRLEVSDEVTYQQVANVMEKSFDEIKESKLGQLAVELVSLGKQTLMFEEDAPVDYVIDELARYYGLQVDEYFEELCSIVPKTLKRCKDEKAIRELCAIDYDDQVYLPVVLKLPFLKFDLLFGDEVQDWNRAQQELVKRCGERLILVGDKNQSIYGFKGADFKSMQRMEEDLSNSTSGPQDSPNVIVLPLTKTWRCGKRIVEYAQQYVPEFEAHESNPEGMVETLIANSDGGKPYWTRTGSLDGLNVQQDFGWTKRVQPGDMILCRINAPLLGVCLKLIAQNKRADILGRNIGAGLRKFVYTLCRRRAATTSELKSQLENWFRRASRIPKMSQAQLTAVKDKYSCVTTLTQGLNTVGQVIDRIKSLFTDDKDVDGIRLSSIHRSKGLEAPRVWIVRPPWQPDRSKMQPWEIQQELNIEYVGCTRPIDELIFVQ